MTQSIHMAGTRLPLRKAAILSPALLRRMARISGDMDGKGWLLPVPVVTGRNRGGERPDNDRCDDGVTFHRCAACEREKTPGELFFHSCSTAQAPALYAILDGVN